MVKRISQKGIDLIKKFEGFKSEEYICPGKKRTIGYGHVLGISEKYDSITKEQGQQLLLKDIENVQYFINKSVSAQLSQGQFDALVSLAYNWGVGNLARSMGLRKLNRGDYSSALSEFMEVNKAGGKVLSGLVERRLAEAELWNDKA